MISTSSGVIPATRVKFIFMSFKSILYTILLEDSVSFGDFNLLLELSADYINNSGELAVYTKDVSFFVDVSLNQAGFPVSTAEFRSSPLVIDLDGDGDVEIIAGDNNGYVHIYNADGSEVEDDTFPFDSGNQIWGSAAAAEPQIWFPESKGKVSSITSLPLEL